MPKDEGYEEKAVDQAAISAFDPEVLSDMVDTAARTNTVMGELLAEVHDRTGDAGSVFEVRERGTLDVQTQPENTEISTEDLSYSTVEIGVEKYGESVTITREAEEDGLDIQQDDVAEELGEAFAESQDQTAYDTLVGNGSVETIELGTAGTLTRDEIADARAEVRANRFDPDAMVVHPDLEAELLKIDDFVQADKYGSPENLRNGEMGRVFGLTVYSSTTANERGTTGSSGVTQVAILDSEEALHRVVKRDITIEIDEQERFDRDTVVGTSRWGHAVVNPGAVCLLQN